MKVQVLMVDDHPPIIEGYKSILSFNTYGYKLETVAAYSCEAAYAALTNARQQFEVVFLDLTLPPFIEKNLHSGEDLIPVVRKYHPESKIVVLTSHSESIALFRVMTEFKPEGILVKSDFQAHELLIAFDTIVRGEQFYSHTVIKHQKTWEEKTRLWIITIDKSYYCFHKALKPKTFPICCIFPKAR